MRVYFHSSCFDPGIPILENAVKCLFTDFIQAIHDLHSAETDQIFL